MNVRVYIADRTPMSRTSAAEPANASYSSSWRPNSFTSSAPATPKRSVIVVFIVGVEVHAVAGDLRQLPADPLGREEEERQEHEREDREAPVERGHGDHDGDQA